jgi:ligand-binding SRPBCC domain-containing protein
MPVFEKRTQVPASCKQVFDWHAHPDAFDRLAPPWAGVHVLKRHRSLTDGEILVLRIDIPLPILKRLPIGPLWIAEIFDVEPGVRFCDRQIAGPFASWEHHHLFEPVGGNPEACWMADRVTYQLPLGAIGEFFGGWLIRWQLQCVFDYRHKILMRWMAAATAAT